MAADSGEFEELYRAAIIAEYTSLREESGQARQAQQATLQWSLATFGAIFAGGLIFLGQASSLDRVHVTSFVYFFGLPVPWFATFASWVWWGECRRMERAGTYLRDVEASLELVYRGSHYPLLNRPPAPLQWERFIAWGPHARLNPKGSGRIAVGYLGALAFTLGSY